MSSSWCQVGILNNFRCLQRVLEVCISLLSLNSSLSIHREGFPPESKTDFHLTDMNQMGLSFLLPSFVTNPQR